MAFALPTTPCTSLLTYAEMDSQHAVVIGSSAGLISTDQGQILAWAADAAYWQIVNCFARHGYTAAQITLWFAAEGHSIHLGLADWFWMSKLGVSRDHPFFADADRFRLRFEKLCEDGGPLFDVTLALLTPDTSRLGDGLQARGSSQNNSASSQHLFRVDADPQSMLAGSASTIVNSTKFANPGSLI